MPTIFPMYFTLGSVGITNVRVHISWFLMMMYLFYQSPDMALLFFLLSGIVMLHEFGHITVAKWHGDRCPEVSLYLFGGLAMIQMNSDPWKEFKTVVGGPMVNLILAVPLLILSMLHPILLQLAVLNLAIFIFNMMPIFPLDGGRIFRALLSIATRDREWATNFAGRIGQVGGVLLACSIYWGQWSTAIIGVFIFMMARREMNYVKSMHKDALERMNQFPLNTGNWKIYWVET